MFSSMLQVYRSKSNKENKDKDNYLKQKTIEATQKNVKVLLNKINVEADDYSVENIITADSEMFSTNNCFKKLSIECDLLDSFDTKSKNCNIGKIKQTSIENTRKKTLFDQIATLHCLFTWKLNSGKEQDIVTHIKNKYNDNTLDMSLPEFTFARFIGNLIISYELFKNGKSYESDMKMLEIGNWLDKLDNSTDEFYLSINIGLKHIRMANFVHILFSTDEIIGSKWLFDEIVPFDNMDNKSKAAVHAIHAVILVEYSQNLNCFKNACEYAKRACELDPETSHWFHIYSLVLIAQRQSVHAHNLYPTENEIQLAIQRAVMFSDEKSTCSINSLILTYLNQFVASNCQMALSVSKTVNSDINSNNIVFNLKEDMNIIIKKHEHGEDAVPHLIALASKYNNHNRLKIIAQICSYTVLFTNNFRTGVEQFLIFIENPIIFNKDLIVHHNSMFIAGPKKFNLAKLICNEIRLTTINTCGTSIEDILFYYKVYFKIKETYNLKLKVADLFMRTSIIENSSLNSTNSVYEDETVLLMNNDGIKNKNVILKRKTKSVSKHDPLENTKFTIFNKSSLSNKRYHEKNTSPRNKINDLKNNINKTNTIKSNDIFLIDMISNANSLVNIFCNSYNPWSSENFNFQINTEADLYDILKKNLTNSQQYYNLYNGATQNHNINCIENNANVNDFQSHQYSESIQCLCDLKLNSSFLSTIDLPNVRTSYITLNSTIIDTTLSALPKSSTSQVTYKMHLKNILQKYHTSFRIYTDASKIQNNVGIAIVSNKDIYCYKLSSEYTSCDAEAVAILRALDYALAENYNDYLILSDSLTTLTNIQNTNTSSDVINSILCLIQAHQLRGNLINIIWIPGHNAIKGNEKADKLAKQIATSSTAITYSHNSF